MADNQPTGNTHTGRLPSLELLRFFAAICILLFHTRHMMFDGVFIHVSNTYLFVEMFFIITGFFLAKYVAESEVKKSIPRFVIDKVKKFYVPALVVLLTCFIMYCQVFGIDSVIGVMAKLVHFLPQFLFVDTISDAYFFQGYPPWLTCTFWYLSAMVISTIVLYTLLRHSKTNTRIAICLSLTVVCYSAIVIYGKLLANIEVPIGFLSTALVRGLAAMSLGVLCYEFTNAVKEKVHENSVPLMLLEVIAIAGISVMFLSRSFTSIWQEFAIVACMFIVVSLCCLNLTPVARELNKANPDVAKKLGIYSLYLFLVQTVVRTYIVNFTDFDKTCSMICMLTFSLALAYILMVFDRRRNGYFAAVAVCVALLCVAFLTPFF